MNTPTYHKGDVVTFLQPWREDEVPDDPTGTGKVLAVFTRGREQWLQIEGRERWVWSTRVIDVVPAVIQLVRKPVALQPRPAA